jgi:hypothetical protein
MERKDTGKDKQGAKREKWNKNDTAARMTGSIPFGWYKIIVLGSFFLSIYLWICLTFYIYILILVTIPQPGLTYNI